MFAKAKHTSTTISPWYAHGNKHSKSSYMQDYCTLPRK